MNQLFERNCPVLMAAWLYPTCDLSSALYFPSNIDIELLILLLQRIANSAKYEDRLFFVAVFPQFE